MLGDSLRRRQPARRKAAGKQERPRRPAVRWRIVGPALLAALVLPFVIGYAIAVFILFPAPQVEGVGIPVPQLVGLEAGRADEVARSAGLAGVEVVTLPHPTQAVGTVTAQSPLRGQQLRAGASVRVAISSGPAQAIVPDVVGFSAERAEVILERFGFSVDRFEQESLEAAGRVIGVDPPAGSTQRLPAHVTLTVSLGPAEPSPDTLVGVDTLAAAPRPRTTPTDWPGPRN